MSGRVTFALPMSLIPVSMFNSRPSMEGDLVPTVFVVTVNADRIRKVREFGLTEYQARVYLALLDLGTATASQIPAISRVPRTRIYATMQQLHEKGLVEIVPETPLKYAPVPFGDFVTHRAQEFREKAEALETSLPVLATEFSVVGGETVEEAGRFEAVYGRRNARERLIKMYSMAKGEAYGIGTTKSPGRIMRAFGSILIEKAKEGVKLKYAFPVTEESRKDVDVLEKYAEVRNIDFSMPVFMHVVDRKEFLMSHPIPDDDSYSRGDDIAIWTNDTAIAGAMHAMAEKIWSTGTRPSLAAPELGAKRKS